MSHIPQVQTERPAAELLTTSPSCDTQRMDYWSKKIQDMPLNQKRVRFMELATKIVNMQVLAKDELSELIALRESLQLMARNAE
jgi:hypothetical protein